jgi:hypothetical protein
MLFEFRQVEIWMNVKIGFVVMTHSKPHQLERLSARLNAMFDHPPIVCHHNFSLCPMQTGRFSKNVSFVRPHVRTAWGAFSCVEAFMRAIEQLYAAPDNPDWFVLLSGFDYPIKPAAQIIRDLSAGDYDAHIEHEPVRPGELKTAWQKESFGRYCCLGFRVPLTQKRIRVKHPLLTRWWVPFSNRLHCYAGSDWICANRRAARSLVEMHKTELKLARHYRRLSIPTESYYHTILANTPGLKLNNNNWRYIDWSLGGPHPKTLNSEDLPKLLASTAHFARKLDLDQNPALYDQLDKSTN